jgi:2'-5' RNA ligase
MKDQGRNGMVRTFVAIDLCDEVRSEIGGFHELLKKSNAKLSFVDPGIIHLTLKFLGESMNRRSL